MDEDADRDPESPGKVEERLERRERLDEKIVDIAKTHLWAKKNRAINRIWRHRIPDSWGDREGSPDDSLSIPPATAEKVPSKAKREVSPLWERIMRKAESVRDYMNREKAPDLGQSEIHNPLAATIGRVRVQPFWPGGHEDVLDNLDGDEVIRLYLYYDLSPIPEVEVARQLRYGDILEELGVSEWVSQSTLNRLPGRLDDRYRNYYASQTETLVRHWQGTRYEDWVRPPTPETIAPDGEGIPPVQTILRELRSETFQYIRLKRDESTKVSKDAAMRVLIKAANSGAFVNDAAKNLDLKPWYDGSEVPTGQTLIHHIQKSSREEITRMFAEANDRLYEILDEEVESDYFPDDAEVAIDITDWPFYGDEDADPYVRGTKPGRNYSRAWKYITLSIVGVDTPFILLTLPVRNKSRAPQYIRRMLRVASQYVNVDRVYLDAGTEFYSADTIATVTELGADLVMQGQKRGDDIKQFLNGMSRLDLDEDWIPYNVGDLPERDDYYAIGLKSVKKSERRESEPDEPHENYTYLYTNLDPREHPPAELGEGFRNRWGIETDFRKIKNDFLAKSASPNARTRTFYFNFAAHLFNLWTAANIRRADEINHDLSEGKIFTAGRVMDALEDDPYDLDIPTEEPETEHIVGTLF